ncbi:PAS domain S-box protein [Poseidonibacter sp.]|uniref:PAS domain S-box protein n=1 Tax=Poseidonibacter sp. TaxID=2321188 RepID=UPI003C7490D7
MSSLSILKEESIQNHYKISELYTKTFSNSINQDLVNIESIIDNLDTVLDLYDSTYVQEKKLNKIIKNYPQIRSFNILNQNNEIIISSNSANIGLKIDTQEYMPKPFFNNNILRVSKPIFARDFYNIDEKKTDNSLTSFVPILKNSTINGSIYKVIINLNVDYFINNYQNELKFDSAVVELVRIDGLVLFSTKDIVRDSLFVNLNKKFLTSLENRLLTEIEVVDNKENIVSYMPTTNYPLIISVKLDLESSLSGWEEKRYKYFAITVILVLVSVLIALFLFFLYSNEKEKEIKLHKLQINDQIKFKALFEKTNMLKMFIELNGAISEVNSVCSQLVNDSFKDIKKMKIWELSCWNTKESQKIKDMILNYKVGSDLEKEFSLTDRFNQKRFFNLIISSLYIDNKISLVVFALDITNKKDKETLLKQSYTVFNNTRDGIMVTNKDGNIVRVNRSFEIITGYKETEVIGKNPKFLQSGVHDKSYYVKMWKDLNENGFYEGEIVNKNKKSEHFTEWLTINTVYDENSKILNYIGVFSDISFQKEQEKILREQEQILFQQSKMAAMGEMIENIAHQWRQPLSVISTVATGLKLQKEFGISKEEDEIKELSAINESAQYLSNTIEDFKGFLKNNKKANSFNSIKLINKALSLIGSKLKNREIVIVKDIEDLDIYTLENELIQVLINILNNAKDALEISKLNDKLIFIEVFKSNNEITIIIKDNAGGIKESIINRIFEPYFTTKHQSQGTGIGLYMSAEIIINHIKGTINVKNEKFSYKNKEYQGALFTISIPIINE